MTIIVSSDVAWDDDHPAGRSLNDICKIAAISIADFIRNDNSGLVFLEVVRTLDKLKPDDLTMIIDGFTRFYFTAAPQSSSKPRIYVRTQMKSGRVLEASLDL